MLLLNPGGGGYSQKNWVGMYGPLPKTLTPGGVLRCISDGDVQSPFLGLKFAI